jgi:hypothetical protein
MSQFDSRRTQPPQPWHNVQRTDWADRRQWPWWHSWLFDPIFRGRLPDARFPTPPELHEWQLRPGEDLWLEVEHAPTGAVLTWFSGSRREHSDGVFVASALWELSGLAVGLASFEWACHSFAMPQPSSESVHSMPGYWTVGNRYLNCFWLNLHAALAIAQQQGPKGPPVRIPWPRATEWQ